MHNMHMYMYMCSSQLWLHNSVGVSVQGSTSSAALVWVLKSNLSSMPGPVVLCRIVALLAPVLVERGILSGCEVTPIAPAEVVAAREIISMGGGWVEPVVELDGQPVGGGLPGPAFRALDELVRADFRNPALTDEVPYA